MHSRLLSVSAAALIAGLILEMMETAPARYRPIGNGTRDARLAGEAIASRAASEMIHAAQSE
jgi:hypothetical protein